MARAAEIYLMEHAGDGDGGDGDGDGGGGGGGDAEIFLMEDAGERKVGRELMSFGSYRDTFGRF